jgi:hypothetical protein
MSTERQLWSRLHAAGLVKSEQLPVLIGTPWYLQVMIAISAWFAAVFLMFSLAALFQELWKEPAGIVVIGGICCAIAIGMLWLCRGPRGRDRVFLQQLALPVSMAGQAMLVLGLTQQQDPVSLSRVGVIMLIVGSVMAAASGQSLHRFGSALHACAGIALLVLAAHHRELLAPIYALASALLWLAAARPSSAWDSRLRPLGYAAAFSLLLAVWLAREPFLLGWSAAGLDEIPMPLLHSGWTVAGVWFGVALALVMRESASLVARVAALSAAMLLAVALHSAPGVLAALMLLVLGFAAGERSLLGIAVAGGLFYLFLYYYEMNLTLLAKSQVLAASGALLLAMRAALMLLRREDAA